MKRHGAFFLATLLLCGNGYAEDFTLLSADIPPYSSSSTTSDGLCIDITKALFDKTDMALTVQFHPWARSQKMAITGERYLITPLTRTREREPHYDWIVPLFRYNLQLVSNDPSVPIDNPQAMHEVEICVLRESPAEYKLIELGYQKRLVVTDESKCLQLLNLKRTPAALLHGMLSAEDGYRRYGGDPQALRQGIAYPSGDIYLASSKGALTAAQRQGLAGALRELKATGQYQQIIDNYRFSASAVAPTP